MRGEDYIIRKISPWRRQLCFTERGMRRLELRAYRVFRNGARAFEAMPLKAKPVRLRGELCDRERKALVVATIQQAFRAYLDHPCAVPSCPCIIHRLGAPQADALADYLLNAVPPPPRPMGG